MERSPSLLEFRLTLEQMMPVQGLRPFICAGSPLDCSAFIVGLNPATAMAGSFWQYWSDAEGFRRSVFVGDYLKKRRLVTPRGNRARIERIVEQLPAGACLETNIYSMPTRRAADLRCPDRHTEIFEFLFFTIKPRVVFAHSNGPIAYFRRHTGVDHPCDERPERASWKGHGFWFLGSAGPLYRLAYSAAGEIGRTLARTLAGPTWQAAGIRSRAARARP
jgi:hypothetical protein